MTDEKSTIVLVHGGSHAGDCWGHTVAAIKEQDPQAMTLSVNLPGRAGEPGDLATLTIDQCVQSVVAQINNSGAHNVILVGHSMAGITLPGVAEALGAKRVTHMVYIACCVPPQGGTVLSTLKAPVSWFANVMSKYVKVSKPMPGPIAAWMFANGMSKEQKSEVLAGLVPESGVVTKQAVDRSNMPDIDTTWILTLQDNSLKPDLQREFIANLGNVDEVIEVDTCHNIMMSEPKKLANLLLQRS